MSYLTELTLDDGIHKQVKDIEASHYLGTTSSNITEGAMASNYSINVSGIVYALNPTNSQKQLSNNDMIASPNGLFIANIIKGSPNTGGWKEIANISNNLVTEINIDDASTIPTGSTVANISTTGSLSGGDAYNKTTNPIATKLYVDSAVDNLPESMVFIGSITITADSVDTSKCTITVSKPSTSSAIRKGFTYKITNISSSPKYTGDLVVGDTLIASKNSPNVTSTWVKDTDWTIVPSGDETGFVVGLPSGTTENNIVTWGADGYNIKNSGISIETTLSVNSDTAIPTSKAIATYATGLINELDATGNSNVSASKTIATWSETNGIVSITFQDISISSAQVSSMSNYSKPLTASAIETTDTLNQAIGKLETGLDSKQNTLSTTNQLNPAYINYSDTYSSVSSTEKSAWDNKQSALSPTQLSAVNSGVNAELVSQIPTNATAISNLQSTVNTKASQSSLNTLSDTVDTKANAESITALQQQIDNLIAPTTQDAEVQNARIGADGSRYTTLGDRLNAEDTQLMGIINTLGNTGTIDMASYVSAGESWVQGVIDGTTGSNINSDKRIRSGYIGGDFVKITPLANTKFYPVFYKSNVFVSSETWSTTTKIYKLSDKSANQVRIVFASSDDSVITTDFASNISVYKKTSNFKNVEFRGTFEDLNITDMDNLKTEGYYTATATTISNVSNYPDKFIGSASVVQVFGNITTADQLTYFQLVTNSGGETAFRYLREFGTKGDWTYTTSKPTFKWFALGDSITQGYYSTGQNQFAITTENWVKFASQILGCAVTNYGIGGSGYMDNVHATDSKNGKQKVDSIDFSQCDLVTLAWGINDWKYGYPLGSMSDDITSGVSVIANMRYCIEKIIADNPLCKIIVVTPLNCRGYDFDYGDESTNYGLGYTIAENGKTLQDFFNGIKEVCEYYGIEMIDQTHNSVVNRKSIVNLLKDGVHPSLECHRVLGFEMGNKINF